MIVKHDELNNMATLTNFGCVALNGLDNKFNTESHFDIIECNMSSAV